MLILTPDLDGGIWVFGLDSLHFLLKFFFSKIPAPLCQPQSEKVSVLAAAAAFV
jgi:hypothetical protein